MDMPATSPEDLAREPEVDFARLDKVSILEAYRMLPSYLLRTYYAEKEVARLRNLLLSEEPLIVKDEAAPFGFAIQHWAVKLMAWSLKDSLGDAPNFHSFSVGLEMGEVIVTVRRRNSKTPEERCNELIQAVREHHAERGHDRCHESDNKLYQVAGLEPIDPQLPPIEEHRRRCDQWRAEKYGVPVELEPCGRVKSLEEERDELMKWSAEKKGTWEENT